MRLIEIILHLVTIVITYVAESHYACNTDELNKLTFKRESHCDASCEVCLGARRIIMTGIMRRNKKVRMQLCSRRRYKKAVQLLSLPSRCSDSKALRRKKGRVLVFYFIRVFAVPSADGELFVN